MSELTIPSPFSKHGLLSTSARAIRAARCVRSTPSGPARKGDISLKEGETSNEYIAWHQPFLGTYNTSALVYGDYYYTLLDRGFLLCHDARTGKQIYGRQRIAGGVSGFTASPWAYNGKIFLLSEDGDTFVVQAGPEYKLLGKNSLERDAAGDAGRGARLGADPHRLEALSHREARVMMRQIARVAVVLAAASQSATAQPVAAPSATLTQVATIHGPAHLVEVHGNRLYVVGDEHADAHRRVEARSAGHAGIAGLPEKIWGIRSRRSAGLCRRRLLRFRGHRRVRPGDAGARGRIKTPGQAKNVAIVGTTALVADHMSGIDIIDVTNAGAARGAGFVFPRRVRARRRQQRIAGLCDRRAGWAVHVRPDEAGAGRTDWLATVGPRAGQHRARVDATGRLDLAVLVGGGLLQVYDLAKPAAPVKVATFQTPSGRPVRATLVGRRAFVADGREGVQVVDLSTPSAPALIGGFKTSAPARDVTATDTAVFVAIGTDEEGEVLVLAR